MTKLQILSELLEELANRIAEADQEQANDDMQAGFIEGKLTAYKEMAKGLADSISRAI